MAKLPRYGCKNMRLCNGRFGIVNALVTTGSAVFTLLMYFLLDFLIDKIGVRRL